MKRRIHRRRLALLSLLLLLSLCLGSAPAALAAPATVEVIACPAAVLMNQPLTVRWRITGGATVSKTWVQWGWQAGNPDSSEKAYAGGPGEYEHTLTLNTAGALYLQVLAEVDGATYRSTEQQVSIVCAPSFSGNTDRVHAAPIALDQTYTGCLAGPAEEWFVAALPGCAALEVYAAPAPGPIGAGEGVSLAVYDAAGAYLGGGDPACGGGLGRCDPLYVRGSRPAAGQVYLKVYNSTADSYAVRASAPALALRSDEFLICNGPSYPCWMPWYWHWTDPRRDSEYDATNDREVARITAPGGAAHDLHETTDAPRYTQSICGDFAVETSITLWRTGSYQSAGLLVWQDARNFLRWEVNDAGGLRALRMRGGSWADSGNLEYLSAPVRLHAQRAGQRLDLFAAAGGAWQHYGSWDLASGAVEVGLFVVNIGPATAAAADFDYFRAVAPRALPATPTPTLTLTPGTPAAPFVWSAEAESGALSAPMAARADAAACGGQFVSSAVSGGGEVSFALAAPQAGNYYLWARAKGGDWTSNSFHVAFDAAAPWRYEVPPFGEQWVWGWDRVHPEGQAAGPVYLAAGAHTLRFLGREPLAALDALLLTSDAAYTPSGCPAPATPTPTPTTTGTPPLTRSPTPSPPPTAPPTATPTAPLPPRLWLPLLLKEALA